MKQYIGLFSLIIFSNITISQVLVDTNKLWVCAEYMNFGLGYTTAYKFQDDTIINGYEYKKLFQTDDTNLTDWGLRGGMREENKIVYFKENDWDDEYVLYNFNLEVGDTFNFVKYSPMIVESIDSVTLLNGEKRKHLYLSLDYRSEEWIEGVGSLFGLTMVAEGGLTCDMWYWLNCFFEDGLLKYKQFYVADECFFNTTGIDKNTLDQKIVVSPNPFNEFAILRFDYDNTKNRRYQLQIHNTQGQLLRSIENISSGNIRIDRKNLSGGIYVYHLLNQEEIIGTGKLM